MVLLQVLAVFGVKTVDLPGEHPLRALLEIRLPSQSDGLPAPMVGTAIEKAQNSKIRVAGLGGCVTSKLRDYRGAKLASGTGIHGESLFKM